MSTFDLLDAVLPTEGRYCVVGIGRYVDQKFYDTREEVDRQTAELVRRGFNAYFGCAKYGSADNRTHENAEHFRALWVDIDCGEEKAKPDKRGVVKGYIDQSTGLSHLIEFCKVANLPRPVLVSSGYGIHAYWLLEEVLTRAQWVPLANRLRELCVEKGLNVDSAVFEPSRILRIPGTFNFKGEEPVDVSVLYSNVRRIPHEEMRLLLGAPPPKEEKPDFIPNSMSPMMEALLANKVKRFKTIMIKSVNGEGCNQLLHCYQNQADIEEPLWRSALSIAAFCVDRNEATHLMSNQYPDYDPTEVDTKVHNLVSKGAPHTCATFERLNPTGCDGCPHKGKIKSPIVLGIEIAEADETDNEVVATTDDGEKTVVQVPEYPFPYFRGKAGGVYRKPKDEEDEPELIYEHDLYVVKRMQHNELGEIALVRVHLPQDGIKEFAIPATSVVVKDKLREMLAHNGVVPTDKQMNGLLGFITSFIKNLQYQKKAEIMRTQFGWVDHDSKFIIGEREITKDGVFYSPPSITTKDIAAHIHVKGSLEKGREVFNMYNLPGLEPNAFAALTGFGSPLLKYTGMSGAIINLIYPTSGTGKSTTLYMCNSVIGHPKDLASIWKDTQNAKMHQLGVMNNLANTVDEITNTSPMEFSDLAYSISQGRGKNRMKSQTNEMRINNTRWQGITLTSSNASFYEKLGVAKNSPDGENMRLLEYKIEPRQIIDVSTGKQLFDHQLFENYGHAAEPYLQWLVNNLEDAKDLLKKVQARIDRELKVTQKERFWSAVAACNITGGLIAKNLGLIDLDMKRLYDWMINMLNEMRTEVKPPESNPVTILGDYINHNLLHALVVNGEADARSNLMALPLQEPKGELLIRYEPDTKDLYITAKSFKDFCVKYQINYKDTIKLLTDTGVFKEAVNKRMSKGMKLVSPAVRALRFNATNFEFLQLEVQPQNEGGDSQLSN